MSLTSHIHYGGYSSPAYKACRNRKTCSLLAEEIENQKACKRLEHVMIPQFEETICIISIGLMKLKEAP